MQGKEKIGLALGGGAVLGAAHVGVLRAIEEVDLKIEFITGTSIGAFVAALFAFGKDWKQIKEIASELDWMDITSISLSRYALLFNQKLGDLLIKHIGDVNIEDSEIPLAFIATDATTGEKVILDKGAVAEAVMASTCIPGIFVPVQIDNRILLDGGIVENVPINTIRTMGAEFVIGVDLNSKNQYQKPKNILDVLLNSFHFLMTYSTKLQTKEADVLIEPDLSAFNRSGMDQLEDLIEKGYEDARKVVKNLNE